LQVSQICEEVLLEMRYKVRHGTQDLEITEWKLERLVIVCHLNEKAVNFTFTTLFDDFKSD